VGTEITTRAKGTGGFTKARWFAAATSFADRRTLRKEENSEGGRKSSPEPRLPYRVIHGSLTSQADIGKCQ
jgi:hypothetical protein